MAVRTKRHGKHARPPVREVIHCRSMVPASIQPVQIREEAGKAPLVYGYGSVFYRADDPGTEYWLFKDLVERIGRPSFDRALKEKDDTRALFNHDPNQIMGRTTASTLRLSVDDIGLRYEFDLPDSPNGANLREALKRGDVTGSSFSFDVEVIRHFEEKDFFVREVQSVKLYDVGPVTFPAYTSATAGLRSAYKPLISSSKRSDGYDDRMQARAELRKWLEEQGPSIDEIDVELALASAKMRMRVRK